MGSHSSVAQGEGAKMAIVLLVFGGLTVANAQMANQEEAVDSESSQSHFIGAGANAAHMGNHGKYFQDFYSLQYGPNQLEFGHVCEDPSTWEQRFERKDLEKQHHQGQVRWGDKHGGYGEHYWDYNHGGHHDGGGEGDGTAPVAEYAEAIEEAPQKKKQYFHNAGSESAPTSTNTNPRRRQPSRQPAPSDGFVAPPKVSTRINSAKLPKAHIPSESQINEHAVEGRLPSSWSPIPSTPPWNRPMTAHQLSRVRRSPRLPTRIFKRTRSLEPRYSA